MLISSASLSQIATLSIMSLAFPCPFRMWFPEVTSIFYLVSEKVLLPLVPLYYT